MKEDDYYERHFNWYKLALCKIATAHDQANPIHLKQLAQAALDGEPTTADKYNVNTGDDVEYNFISPNDPGDENDSSK